MALHKVGAGFYATIQQVVTASADGDINGIANSTHVLGSTFVVDWDLTITGTSEAGVNIGATGVNGYRSRIARPKLFRENAANPRAGRIIKMLAAARCATSSGPPPTCASFIDNCPTAQGGRVRAWSKVR